MGLSIVAAIGLLVLIVWALHRNQQRKNEENVDRNLPLPPLELRESDVTEMNAAEEILGIAPEPSSLTLHPSTLGASQGSGTPNDASDQWLAVSRELLTRGEFDEALSVCKSALPQMGAFRQACIVLRALIRDLKKQGKSCREPLLELYQVAALADFFHAKVANAKTLTPALIKQIDFRAWQSLDTPYAMLGYERLTLLTKTDAKWFVQEWGEPDKHGQMHELHPQQWNAMRHSLL